MRDIWDYMRGLNERLLKSALGYHNVATKVLFDCCPFSILFIVQSATEFSFLKITLQTEKMRKCSFFMTSVLLIFFQTSCLHRPQMCRAARLAAMAPHRGSEAAWARCSGTWWSREMRTCERWTRSCKTCWRSSWPRTCTCRRWGGPSVPASELTDCPLLTAPPPSASVSAGPGALVPGISPSQQREQSRRRCSWLRMRLPPASVRPFPLFLPHCCSPQCGPGSD